MKKFYYTLLLILIIPTLISCKEKQDDLPPTEDIKIMAYGDSLTYGYGLEREQTYPYLLSEVSGYNVINAGKNGDTAKRTKNRLISDLEYYKPNIVLLSIGGNDMLRNKDENLKNDLIEIIQTIKQKNAKTILIAQPKPSLFNLKNADVYNIVSNEENVILLDSSFTKYLSESEYKLDRIHLNYKGNVHFVNDIYNELKEKNIIKW